MQRQLCHPKERPFAQNAAKRVCFCLSQLNFCSYPLSSKETSIRKTRWAQWGELNKDVYLHILWLFWSCAHCKMPKQVKVQLNSYSRYCWTSREDWAGSRASLFLRGTLWRTPLRWRLCAEARISLPARRSLMTSRCRHAVMMRVTSQWRNAGRNNGFGGDSRPAAILEWQWRRGWREHWRSRWRTPTHSTRSHNSTDCAVPSQPSNYTRSHSLIQKHFNIKAGEILRNVPESWYSDSMWVSFLQWNLH